MTDVSHLMKASVLLTVTLSLLTGCVRNASSEAAKSLQPNACMYKVNSKGRVCMVSIVALIASPNTYSGTLVETYGPGMLRDDDKFLCLRHTDLWRDIGTQCLLLHREPETDFDEFSDMSWTSVSDGSARVDDATYFRVTGVFRVAGPRDSYGYFGVISVQTFDLGLALGDPPVRSEAL